MNASNRPRLRWSGVALLHCITVAFVGFAGAISVPAVPPDGAARAPTASSFGAWRRIAPPDGARGGAPVAFVHTANVERSDPRLAGLMLRCNGSGIEAVIVVVEAFPPKARPRITLRVKGEEAYFETNVVLAGTGLAIAADRLTSADGPWREADELEVHIGGRDAGFGGIVPLRGLASVVNSLTVDCARG